MLRANDLSLDSPYYRRFTDSQLDRLHEASLEILQEIGVRFRDSEALGLFKAGGAHVDGDLVRIPAWRVEWARRAAPKRLVLHDQTGEPAIRLGGRCAYFGNGSDLLYILDHRTGERRAPVLSDVEDMIRTLQSLEHFDFIMSGFLPRDVEVERAERLQVQAMLRYSTKPMIYVTTDLPNAQAAVEMCEAVAGGEEALRLRPFALCYINITNPLLHNPESIQKLVWLSRKGLPFTYRPSLMTRGVTTPITGAGFLAVNNVSGLAGLVLSQLTREGAPFVRDACAGGTFDMRCMMGQHSAPEIRGFNEELLHYYGLPGFGIGGTTGAKTIDAQAAFEASLTLLTSVLAGAQLIHDVGYMDNGVTGSLQQTVICNEIIGWIKAYMQPLEISDETLALDAVRDVVLNGGDFLGSENVLRHFREDLYPKLTVRQNHDGWAAGGSLSMQERARQQVEKVLGSPSISRLGDAEEQSIQRIVDRPR